MFFENNFQTYFAGQTEQSERAEALDLARNLYAIGLTLKSVPVFDEVSLEALIPISHQLPRDDSAISLPSAMLYMAIHPVLTDLNLFTHDINGQSPSLRLVRVIARSASAVIDHLTELNQNRMIISIWLAAEEAMKAGVVKVSCIIFQRRVTRPGVQSLNDTESSVTLKSITKVSSLLASFAARWPAGAAYVNAWEALVELMWASV